MRRIPLGRGERETVTLASPMTKPASMAFLASARWRPPWPSALQPRDIRRYVYDTPRGDGPFVKRGANACASAVLVAPPGDHLASLPNTHVSAAVAAEIGGGSAVEVYAEMSRIGQRVHRNASRRFWLPAASPASTRLSAAVQPARRPGN